MNLFFSFFNSLPIYVKLYRFPECQTASLALRMIFLVVF
ncbi:Uncharacterized protein dnm_042920 [Desulfonema magnum]|uniref:Uncharacterized protein n=1 Tax=Desulfonema magnum TaxID=45655 RepID=A0A975BMM8_9BACT|nr:Uncharacterized protein dnm_042920 [Desulfonema magnum]